MKKLLFILLIFTACAKDKCEEIEFNVQLGVTYTAESDGILTVINNDTCILNEYNADGVLQSTIDSCDCPVMYGNEIIETGFNSFNISKGNTFKVYRVDKSYYVSSTDLTYISQCSGDIISTFKTECKE